MKKADVNAAAMAMIAGLDVWEAEGAAGSSARQ